MKLIAMMIVKNEADRFLPWTLPALNEFVDEIRVIDDGSVDGTYTMLRDHGCVVKRDFKSRFYEHEGRARNLLLDFVLEGEPTHIIAIDADEMVEDGQEIRRRILANDTPRGVWNLTMEEVWKADGEQLYERVDGQWGSRRCPIVFEVPARRTAAFRISDRALACGREPMQVAKAGMRNAPVICSVFHLGWSCQAEREGRWHRYVVHDGGVHHRSAHLDSIMFDDTRVALKPRGWPESWAPYKDRLLERINRGQS